MQTQRHTDGQDQNKFVGAQDDENGLTRENWQKVQKSVQAMWLVPKT